MPAVPSWGNTSSAYTRVVLDKLHQPSVRAWGQNSLSPMAAELKVEHASCGDFGEREKKEKPKE